MSETFSIKLEAIESKLRELAEKNPDKKAGCVYTNLGEPCCIVGHALIELGVSKDFLYNMEGENVAAIIPKVDSRYHNFSQEIAWSLNVQKAQDDGSTWAEAVALADKEKAELATVKARLAMETVISNG